MKTLSWRTSWILALALASVILLMPRNVTQRVYDPAKSRMHDTVARRVPIKLGLDLKGGVQLVMRVETDDALRVKTEQDSGRLQEELKRRGLLTRDARKKERRKAGLLNLHGVDQTDITKVVEIGRKLADYRAGITAKALAASKLKLRPVK